jgi:A/G-specific adenine glycosylase
MMLQQTQVPRVQRHFGPFLERFPSARACASAPVGHVVAAWSGLGYNRRAVNLHRSAAVMVERHGGRVPHSLPDLLALPGVGSYTARAVLVFAFGHDLGLIDTTAGRVVARAFAGRPLRPVEAQNTADGVVPRGDAWAWGQAVFDLGALVCTKRSPACASCPLRSSCAWARNGFSDPDPADGSAGVSRPQAPFEGSARQARGRLLRALTTSPMAADEVPVATADSLVRDGLAVWSPDGSTLTLP